MTKVLPAVSKALPTECCEPRTCLDGVQMSCTLQGHGHSQCLLILNVRDAQEITKEYTDTLAQSYIGNRREFASPYQRLIIAARRCAHDLVMDR
mmetsp:Transcript_11609/g.27819  ORF Transcript_11609/g.27819 Transcript_11609/m.27819 type:complete len:94 (-) Transcript_11609:957-1238(-)